jgi:hypothetical protein
VEPRKEEEEEEEEEVISPSPNPQAGRLLCGTMLQNL